MHHYTTITCRRFVFESNCNKWLIYGSSSIPPGWKEYSNLKSVGLAVSVALNLVKWTWIFRLKKSGLGVSILYSFRIPIRTIGRTNTVIGHIVWVIWSQHLVNRNYSILDQPASMLVLFGWTGMCISTRLLKTVPTRVTASKLLLIFGIYQRQTMFLSVYKFLLATTL